MASINPPYHTYVHSRIHVQGIHKMYKHMNIKSSILDIERFPFFDMYIQNALLSRGWAEFKLDCEFCLGKRFW